jgi:hypothetical protein
VDVTVYLPDELGVRAKEADPALKFSRLLRDAVLAELARREAIKNTLAGGVAEHEVSLGDYDGVIVGKLLGVTRDGIEVYLTDDERVLVHDPARDEVEEFEDPRADFDEWLQNPNADTDTIAGIMRQLGLRPRVRL